MPKAKKKTTTAPTSLAVSILRSGALSSALGAAVTAALISATAVLISKTDITSALYEPITTAIISVGTLVAAYITCKKRRSDGLAVGATAGGLLFCALALAAAVFTERGITSQALVKLLALVSAGGIGGVLGVSAKSKAKKLARS